VIPLLIFITGIIAAFAIGVWLWQNDYKQRDDLRPLLGKWRIIERCDSRTGFEKRYLVQRCELLDFVYPEAHWQTHYTGKSVNAARDFLERTKQEQLDVVVEQ
jgi:hypothetical protein